MTFCEKCGTQFTAAYCTKCGIAKPQPLPPMSTTTAESKFCTSCGKAVAAAYCTGCGKALSLNVGFGRASAFAKPVVAASGAAPAPDKISTPVPIEWVLMGIAFLFALSTMNLFGGLMLLAVLVPAAVLVYDSALYAKLKLILNAGGAALGLLFAILATVTGTFRFHPAALVLCIIGLLFVAFIGVRDMLKLKFPDGCEKMLAFIESPMYFYILTVYFAVVTIFMRISIVLDFRRIGGGRETISANFSGGRIFASLVVAIILLAVPAAIAYVKWRGITGLIDKLLWALGGVALFSIFIMPLFYRRGLGVPVLYVVLGYGAVALIGVLLFWLKDILLGPASAPGASAPYAAASNSNGPAPSTSIPGEPGYIPANVDRVSIKRAAKEAFKQQWGTSIGTPLLVGLVSSFIGIFGIPFTVNTAGVFHKIYKRQNTGVGDAFSGQNYGRKLGGMLLVGLFFFLWYMLFIIPGIIKLFSYSMTAFILAEYPNVTARQAIKLSMRMTKGHKGKLFVTGLSFIGWLILGGLTFNILTLVFVMPYMYTTFAGFYEELKKKALETGAISAEELV